MTRTTEPTSITQGDRVEWTRHFDDFSASEYTLEYRFRGQGYGFNVTANADGDDFNAVITADVSIEAAVTRYAWQAWLTEIADTDNTLAAADGTMDVRQGFSSSSTAAVDMRSPNKIALDAINAAIAGKATADMLEYEISTPAGTRRVKRIPVGDLIQLRKEYARLVATENARERARRTGQFGSRVNIRMFAD